MQQSKTLFLAISLALFSSWANSQSLFDLFTEEGVKMDLQAADKLIKQGADVNEISEGGVPLLIWAIENKQEEFAKFLIEKGANPNSPADGIDGYGSANTALIEASSFGYADLVKLLVAKNAYINWENKFGRTALDYAKEKENKEIFDFLVSKNAKAGKEYGKLFEAAAYGDNAALEKLIAAGVDINQTDENGFSALKWAVSWQQEASVKLLLKNGADPADALLAVPYDDVYSMTSLLIENAANINAKNSEGETVLMHLVLIPIDAETKIKSMELLLSKGADIQAKNNAGETVIDLAKKYSQDDPEMEKVLQFLQAKTAN